MSTKFSQVGFKLNNYESKRSARASYYSWFMKSEDAAPALRRLTENAVRDLGHEFPPQERFDVDAALLVCPSGDGWAIGLRVDFTPESWSIAEVVAIPSGTVRTLPAVNTESLQSYVETAVDRARRGQRAAAERRLKLERNAEFIQRRFETWLDKKLPKTNVEYAALAAKYAEQVRLGNSRATATLAEQVQMSPSVMAQRIKEARRRALLTRGEQGRASGDLTPLGVLYADPEFPGLRALQASGMSQRDIAAKYGMSEALVWRGAIASFDLDEENPPLPESGVSASAEQIMRRDDQKQ